MTEPTPATADQVIADFMAGRSDRDPFDDVAVLGDEVRRLRLELERTEGDLAVAVREASTARADVERLAAENGRLVRQQDATQVANIASRRSLCEQRDRLIAERDALSAEAADRLRQFNAAKDQRDAAERRTAALSAVIDDVRFIAKRVQLIGWGSASDYDKGGLRLASEVLAALAAGLAAPVEAEQPKFVNETDEPVDDREAAIYWQKRFSDKAFELWEAVGVIQDIAEHANPIAHDADGFVATGYTVTVGAIHRALGWLRGKYAVLAVAAPVGETPDECPGDGAAACLICGDAHVPALPVEETQR